MAGRASASPPYRVQTWQDGQNAAVPVEAVEGEDAETMKRAQTSQPMLRPLTPLLPGRRLCRTPLSALDGSMTPRNSPGWLLQLWTPTLLSTLPTTLPQTSSLPLTNHLPTAAAVDVFPIASAAAISHAEKPTAANILHRDGLANGAADANP